MTEEVTISGASISSNNIIEGDHFDRIKEAIPGNENKERLARETREIVEKLSYENQTGLIVGRVQSGKTLSFEAVTGMARDNGAQLVIILAGISKILTNQTLNRIKKDFKYSEKKDWVIVDTEGGLPGNFENTLKQNIEKFNRDGGLKRKKGTIIVCMKQHQHIAGVNKVLESSKIQQVLKKAKVLIIDDEADQYSLNTKPDKDFASATYNRINELRKSAPNHTYLSYTATPQAPLLIKTMDMLSPDFAEVVNPGDGYVGIEDLFFEDSPYIAIVESSEEDISEEENTNLPPESLKRALANFLIGAAQGLIEQDASVIEEDASNRSMLIHPSRLIGDQNQFYNWVSQILAFWDLEFENRELESFLDTRNLFAGEYDNLASTYSEIAEFDYILKIIKEDVFPDYNLEQINSGPKATAQKVDWDSAYAFIIVAGQSMDRGTTVEGLTVTYLSRTSSKQIDTQMQRARFLGYKEKYKGLIRIYLDDDSIKFFRNYVITQSDFLNLISEFSGKNFKEVKRKWKIEAGKKSCRDNIVSLEGAIVVSNRKGRWSLPRSPQESNYENNNAAIQNYLDKLTFGNCPQSGVSDATKHLEVTVPFNDVYSEIFSHPDFGYNFPPDADSFMSVFFYLQHLYFHWDDFQNIEGFKDVLMCRIVNINADGVRRKRGLKENKRFKGYLQGKSAAKNYVGDANIYSPESVTLQIHSYDLYEGSDPNNIVYTDIKLPAIRLPDILWKNFDLQTQSKSDAAEEFDD
mgnify:CR=1 FL=1